MRSRNVPNWMVVIASMLVFLYPLVGKSRGDFILSDDQQLTVNSFHHLGNLWDMSRASITSGGDVNFLNAHNSSTVDISGGSVYELNAFDSSQVKIFGGSIEQALHASNNSQITVSGGATDDIYTYDSSQVTVSGGSINDFHVGGSSQITVSGGLVNGFDATGSSQITVSGGSFVEMGLHHDVVLTIYGSNFAVDGTSVGYTELYSIIGDSMGFEPHRQLTGTLLNGDPLNTDFQIGHNAKIALTPVPSAILLGSIGLSVASMKLRKRKEL